MPAPWLLLIHQLPPKPDYLRVKVRRRLHQLGAVALKNTVYVLPRSEETLEDFQWLRREILGDGGEAMLLESEFLEGVSGASLESQFREERSLPCRISSGAAAVRVGGGRARRRPCRGVPPGSRVAA